VLAHARAFFPDFSPASVPDESIAAELHSNDASTREYLCYLLLDFSMVDRDLEDVPLAAAMEWSKRLELVDQFDKLAIKELGIGKRQLTKLRREAAEIVANVEVKA
jgi:hypothetical protein